MSEIPIKQRGSGWSLDQLKWSLQAIALPVDDRRQLFPSFVWVGDELALDFSLWCENASKKHAFTRERLAALAAIDAVLSKMTQENNMEFWDEPGVDHPRWCQVREIAKEALIRFGWCLAWPPKDRSIYVGPPQE
jgi:hypothetical protein